MSRTAFSAALLLILPLAILPAACGDRGQNRDALRSDEPTEADLSLPGRTERLFHVCAAGLSDSRHDRSGAVIVLTDMTRIRRLENLRGENRKPLRGALKIAGHGPRV